MKTMSGRLRMMLLVLGTVGGLALAGIAPTGTIPAQAATAKPAGDPAGENLGERSKGSPATVQIGKDPGIYASEPPSLTVTQCGQCHPGPFGDLKTNGGRHEFTCQGCHQTFHNYNPRKNNWDAVMPKCSNCHSGATVPHFKMFPKCDECHANPHGIAKMTITPKLLNSCAICHHGPPEQLQKFPSKHTNLSCADCHTSHGAIPSCNSCHKPHYEGQEFKTCASECHPVHMPKQISYTKDVGARTCGSCHDKVYAIWTKTPSRHGKVNCAACHSRHGYIPQCAECHKLPHSKQLHDRYPKCLTCHQDTHNPPVRTR
jgi:hypothetical protein